MNREWRNTRRVGWLLGSTSGLVIMVMLTNSIYQAWRLERLQRELVAQGEVLEWRELVPRHLDLTANGGDEFIAAMETVPTDLTRASRVWFWTHEGTGRKVPVLRQEFAGRCYRQWDEYWVFNVWQEASRRLEPWRETLVLALRALTNEVVLRRVDYFEEEDRMDNSLTVCWVSYVEWQRLLAVMHLRDGNRGAALRALKNGYELIARSAGERMSYFQNRRVYMAAVLSVVIWEILQLDEWNDSELASLQALLDLSEFAAPTLRAMEMGRADTIKTWKRDSVYRWLETDSSLRDSLPRRLGFHGAYFVLRTQFAAAGLKNCLEQTQIEMMAAREAVADCSGKPFAIVVQKGLIDIVPGFYYTSSHQYRTRRAFGNLMQAETEREMCRAAIGLCRFELAKGHYPDALRELVPKYLSKLPRDWFAGRPLRYERQGDEFRLWAAGLDGIDDGGNPAVSSGVYHWFAGKDWVWPRKMSPKMIAAHVRLQADEWQKWTRRHP